MALEHVTAAIAEHGHNAQARAGRYIEEVHNAVAAAGTDPAAVQALLAEMKANAAAHAEAITSDPPEATAETTTEDPQGGDPNAQQAEHDAAQEQNAASTGGGLHLDEPVVEETHEAHTSRRGRHSADTA